MVPLSPGPIGARLAAAGALLVAAMLLTACGGGEPVRADRFYRLDPVPLMAPAGPASESILLVHDLAARGFLGGRQIVYRTREEPLVAGRYPTLLWEDPPTRAIPAALVAAIRAAQVFEYVVIPAERAQADYILGGEVERFEHLPTHEPPRVVASMTLALVRADDRHSVLSRQYSGEEPVAGEGPDAMADAFNRLIARLAAEAVADLQSIRGRLAP